MQHHLSNNYANYVPQLKPHELGSHYVDRQ